MSDYDTPSACWTTRPRARKDHTCCECGNTIHKGEVYQSVSGVWSGQFDHYKTCAGCEALRDMLYSECMRESEAEEFMNPMEVLGAMGS